MITCTRKLTFEAGHRVLGHENKCAKLHGHSYKAFIYAKAPGLDSVGRVIDFGVLKQILGAWIDRHWDHTTLLSMSDPLIPILSAADQKLWTAMFNPTAESLAQYLLELAPKLMPPHIEITQVDIWETENCFATARLDKQVFGVTI